MNEKRVIKFRAFDKTTGEMSEGKDIYDFLVWNENWFGARIHFKSGYYAPYVDCDIMQFTGLTDSKGVEIYEGDIVISAFTPYEDGEAQAAVIEEGEVVFKDGSFSIIDRPLHQWIHGEVIGNIHQHKNLLQ